MLRPSLNRAGSTFKPIMAVAALEEGVIGPTETVNCTGQYQEIQYVLPEVVDLANYSTLIIDVVSSGTLDIKYVNPEATENEWGQLAQFADNYTADGITEPLYLDLTGYASYDLSQINFMTCADNITFTLKSMTFVK